MSKERREKQAAKDKKLAKNEILAEPKGDLKGYRKATMEEELKLTKSLANLGIMGEKTGRLNNEIQVHKANAQNAEQEYHNALVTQVQAQQAHKKLVTEFGLDPADAENLKDQDGVLYIKVAKVKKEAGTPPPPVALEPGKPVEIAPGIEATLNKK